MAIQASIMLRRCTTQFLQTTSANLTASANFHSSETRQFNKNEKGMYTCTMIPGDGVSIQKSCTTHFVMVNGFMDIMSILFTI